MSCSEGRRKAGGRRTGVKPVPYSTLRGNHGRSGLLLKILCLQGDENTKQ